MNTKTSSPWSFFIIALGISWFFWLWIILLNWNVFTFPAIIFGAIGLLGPTISEILLIFHSKNNKEWIDYRQRIFDIKRIGKKWHFVIWFTFPILNIVAIALSIFTGSDLPDFETVKNLLSNPWQIFPFAFFILIYGPLPEELGWRGYALDKLQERYNALVSSLILGVMWSLWHVPLFFMKGQWQHDALNFGTLDFWIFILNTIVLSILFTWIYNNTNHSTLSAILFHFMCNFTGQILPLTMFARLYSFILTIVLTISVVIIWGPKTLTRHQNKKKTKS
ncbi:type II CAAX endopeptidase family protein [Marinitoga aeolica]|uniref:CPBP family intramembrane metalloprotease n=1 Tax=Marinitoga aeolica TaxID=2809031 RepID=A0ABY8PSH5_9BACT|nr:type II CAAX endopeptidase family protein [Marinitoga aeolica]WGS65581.1 CPBP family intramembrane metalloprotease [Marinitoga aeolica]